MAQELIDEISDKYEILYEFVTETIRAAADRGVPWHIAITGLNAAPFELDYRSLVIVGIMLFDICKRLGVDVKVLFDNTVEQVEMFFNLFCDNDKHEKAFEKAWKEAKDEVMAQRLKAAYEKQRDLRQSNECVLQRAARKNGFNVTGIIGTVIEQAGNLISFVGGGPLKKLMDSASLPYQCAMRFINTISHEAVEYSDGVAFTAARVLQLAVGDHKQKKSEESLLEMINKGIQQFWNRQKASFVHTPFWKPLVDKSDQLLRVLQSTLQILQPWLASIDLGLIGNMLIGTVATQFLGSNHTNAQEDHLRLPAP